MTDDLPPDVPDRRKGRLINIALALGLSDDAHAMRERMKAGDRWTPEFIQPIQARLDAELAKTDERIAANEAARQKFRPIHE